MAKHLAAAFFVVIAFAATSVAVAAPGSGGSKSSYAPRLEVTWPASAASASSETPTPYVVGGCGYDSSYGGVTVVVSSPYAIQFAGQMPQDGCVSLTNFSTLGAGHYEVKAWQTMRKKDVVVASTSFDVEA